MSIKTVKVARRYLREYGIDPDVPGRAKEAEEYFNLYCTVFPPGVGEIPIEHIFRRYSSLIRKRQWLGIQRRKNDFQP